MSRWRNHHPRWIAELLQPLSAKWWLCGGWALELFAAQPIREHSDLEIGCFRSDILAVIAILPGWDVQIARNKALSPFDATTVLSDKSAHGLWCRRAGGELWDLEILLEERDGEEWVYRRDNRIRRAVNDLCCVHPEGIAYLRPEVQLLYKSRTTRPKDDEDFRVVWPLLDAHEQAWLANAIRLTAPECEWPV
jgi:hypothetical protein